MAFDSTFWVAIAFLVFIIAVFKPLRKATAGALDDKIAQIRREVEEAQRLREEAQSTLASYQLKQRDAGQEVQLMMEQAKSEAEAHRMSAKIALEASPSTLWLARLLAPAQELADQALAKEQSPTAEEQAT